MFHCKTKFQTTCENNVKDKKNLMKLFNKLEKQNENKFTGFKHLFKALKSYVQSRF